MILDTFASLRFSNKKPLAEPLIVVNYANKRSNWRFEHMSFVRNSNPITDSEETQESKDKVQI